MLNKSGHNIDSWGIPPMVVFHYSLEAEPVLFLFFFLAIR